MEDVLYMFTLIQQLRQTIHVCLTARLIPIKQQPLQTTGNLQLMNKALIFFTIDTYQFSTSKALQPIRGPTEVGYQ